MLVLADAYATTTDDGQRYTIERLYDALNSDGGTIGEALGAVELFGVDPEDLTLSTRQG